MFIIRTVMCLEGHEVNECGMGAYTSRNKMKVIASHDAALRSTSLRSRSWSQHNKNWYKCTE